MNTYHFKLIYSNYFILNQYIQYLFITNHLILDSFFNFQNIPINIKNLLIHHHIIKVIWFNYNKNDVKRIYETINYRQNSEKQRIEYVHESINQLVRDCMDCDNVNKRKYYENELKDAINFGSDITDEPIKIHVLKQ